MTMTACIIDYFHNLCLSHIVNLAVQSCIEFVHKRVFERRSVFSTARSSVKRGGIVEDVKNMIPVKQDPASLDVEIRWSSILYMIKKKNACRRVIHSKIRRIIKKVYACRPVNI